jgi:broad specificity phosphatase PhoE
MTDGMTDQTTVHVLRHGEVDNPAKILYGRMPGYLLSDLGKQMAVVAADALSAFDIVHVRSSPLERAMETAAPIAARFTLDVTPDDRLLESSNWFEGMTFGVGDGALRHPRNWWVLRNPFTPSWGEPYRVIAERMFAAVEAARDASRGREAVCVSHQLPIWTLRRFLERKRLWHDPRGRECALASLTSITFDGDRVAGIRYSEPAAHLIARNPDAQTAKGA